MGSLKKALTFFQVNWKYNTLLNHNKAIKSTWQIAHNKYLKQKIYLSCSNSKHFSICLKKEVQLYV